MSLCKAKLQKLDLVSMTDSTKAPSALDALDSDEEDRMSLDSVSAITSGKRSKAKPQHMRNENAQAKNLRKAFVFQKLMTKEEADAMTNQQCFAFRELNRENKRAISTLSAAKLEAMKDQERNMVEEMVSFTGWIEAEMGNDITVEEQVQFRKRWLVKTDYGQGYLCQLCGKETYGGLGCPHLMSTTHKEKEREEILMDRVFGTPEARKSRRFGEDATRRQGQQCASIGGPTWRIWSHFWRWRCNVENKSALSTAKAKKLRPTWSARTCATGSTWHWSSVMRPRVVTGIAPFGCVMSGCETLSRRLRMKIWRELMRRTRRKVTNGGQLSCAKWVKTIQKPSRKSSPILFMWSFVSTRF